MSVVAYLYSNLFVGCIFVQINYLIIFGVYTVHFQKEKKH